MNDKYTIIDNFDKLDLSFMTDFGPEGPISKYNIEDKITLDQIDNELINPLVTQNTDTIPNQQVWNYSIPFNFSSAFNFIPDMLRYITSRKFYIAKADAALIYPTKKQRELSRFPEEIGGINRSYVPNILETDYFFDVTNIEKNFNDNSIVYKNTLSLGSYYNRSQVDLSTYHHSWWLQSDVTFSQVQNTLNQFRIEALTKDVAFENSPFKSEGKANKILFNLEEDASNVFKYSTISFLPLFPDNNGMLPVFVENPVFRDVLQKLILFNKFVVTSSGFGPNLLRHLYFVADLPKGTDQISKPEEFDVIVNPNVVLINPTYNYFAEYSERQNTNINEWQLPNLYVYHLLRSKKSAYYKNLAKLGQNVEIDPEEFSLQNYYNLAASSQIPALPQPDFFDEMPIGIDLPTPYRYKNVVVANKNYLNQANSIADIFPMYNKITIPSKDSDFMKLVEDNGLTNKFMTLLGNYFSSVRSEEASVHRFALHNGSSGPDAKLSATYLQVMNISDFFDNLSKYEKYFYDDKNVKLGFDEPSAPLGPSDGLISDLFVMIKEAAQNHFGLNKLLFSEIYEGRKCHTEVLAFEIAKFKTINGVKTHLQSIFLPSLFSGEEISYIDTQVFYDQEYVYEIFTHSLVIGSKYYLNRDVSDYNQTQIPNTGVVDGEDFKDILSLPNAEGIPNDPVALVVRSPYYNNRSLVTEQRTTLLRDKPPLPPDVTFYPYKDDENKILVLLNINYGERQLLPIRVFQQDEEKIKEYAKSQLGENNTNGRITYKTDDAKGRFLIYRTTTKPTGWSDFVNSTRKQLNSEEGSGYDDIILPNTDYYYFARFEDVHGNISNPTEIFYIRIVKEGGFPPYLVTHVVEFEKPSLVYEKSFKKYLKIRLPDEARELLNGDDGIIPSKIGYINPNSVLGEGLSLGAHLSGTELKKYKVRITSKKTGKKIDINIDFNKKVNTNYLNKTNFPFFPASLSDEEMVKEIKKVEGNLPLNNPDPTAGFDL
jgi:hypothetical protein